MSNRNIIMIVSAAVVVALATAAPHAVRRMDLAAAANKTVCPIDVHINEVHDRIPMRIKELRCQRGVRQMCEGPHGHQPHLCCNHKSDHQERSCVEIRDTVLVKYTDGAVKTLEVSVGCTCMIDQSHRAEAAT